MSGRPSANEVALSERTGHRWFWRGAYAVISTLIAGAAGVGGSYLGAHAVVQSSHDQIQAAAAQAVRDKRAAVYSEYLTTANAYSVQVGVVRDFVKRQPKGFKPVGDREPFNTLLNTRYDYQGAINNVSVYGSDAAWQALLQVEAAFPPLFGGLVPGPVDGRAFKTAYNNFLTVFCQEVPAVPRAGCGR